jgi:DNA-binding NarL/FixJ family response regulator
MARATADSSAVRSAHGDGDVARVLVVDDQRLFRDVMRAVVEATPRLKLVGEATSAEDALLAVDELTPEFVILDIRMPGRDGLEVARLLLERTPPPVVLLVSAQPPPTCLPTAADGSVVAFLAKERLCPSVLLKIWDARGLIECERSREPHSAA